MLAFERKLRKLLNRNAGMILKDHCQYVLNTDSKAKLDVKI